VIVASWDALGMNRNEDASMSSLPLNQPLKPVTALLAYKIDAPTFGRGQQGSRYYSSYSLALMTHEIMEVGGHCALGAGRPLSEQDKSRLVKLLLGESSGLEFLPSNLLVHDRARLVWYRRGEKRRMYFKTGAKPFHLDVQWPHLIFDASERSFRAAAFCGSRRPAPSTRLYIPPLMNLSRNGAICRGSASERIGFGIDDIPRWESVMYETNFSHTNTDQTVRADTPVSNADHVRFWRRKEKRDERVRAAEMTPMGRTLGEWLQGG
jgi:PRTRC genetic system protein B